MIANAAFVAIHTNGHHRGSSAAISHACLKIFVALRLIGHWPLRKELDVWIAHITLNAVSEGYRSESAKRRCVASVVPVSKCADSPRT
jgi:hypothetical protein